jgi:hypothetical protein
MDEFVLDASDRLEQVYRLLWPVPPNLDSAKSALQLLEGNHASDHSHR